ELLPGAVCGKEPVVASAFSRCEAAVRLRRIRIQVLRGAGMNQVPEAAPRRSRVTRLLHAVERVGNRLPDPAVLFLLLMLATWAISALLSSVSFAEIDPRSGDPVVINNLLSGGSLTAFMATMVSTFVNFAPLGVVLVAMLGLGVAEHTGFINALLRAILSV